MRFSFSIEVRMNYGLYCASLAVVQLGKVSHSSGLIKNMKYQQIAE